MKTIEEMLALDLLTPQEHQEIAAWIARAKTPEAILEMHAPLWRALERASAAMNIEADLTRPPPLGANG